MSLIRFFILLIVGSILFSCKEKKCNCNSDEYTIIDENTTYRGRVEHTYDIEFSDFDQTCVNEAEVRNILKHLLKKKELEFPVSSIRCFKSNGGGILDDLSTPAGDNELMFLIIRDIDSILLSFDYEIR